MKYLDLVKQAAAKAGVMQSVAKASLDATFKVSKEFRNYLNV